MDPITLTILALGAGAGIAGLIKRRRAKRAAKVLAGLRDVVQNLPRKK